MYIDSGISAGVSFLSNCLKDSLKQTALLVQEPKHSMS